MAFLRSREAFRSANATSSMGLPPEAIETDAKGTRGSSPRRSAAQELAGRFQITGEARLLFDHLAAQTHFGASVFWVRRPGCFGGEQAAIEHWQTKRDRGKRGIV